MSKKSRRKNSKLELKKLKIDISEESSAPTFGSQITQRKSKKKPKRKIERAIKSFSGAIRIKPKERKGK